MPKIALTGGAYQAYSVIASAQRSLNLYAEPMPSEQGEPQPVAHYPTPGLQLDITIGTGPIRGILEAPNSIVYVVSGSDVWSMEYTGGPPTAPTFTTVNLGSITPGLTTPVSMVDNGLDLVIVDGSTNFSVPAGPWAWSVHIATNVMTPIPDVGFFVGANRVDYLDGYFIFNQPFTQNFQLSQYMSPTFDPLGQDYAAKITHSDLLTTLIVSKRLVYLFGSRMTEIWYDAGATDTGAGSFPFAEMQSEVIIDHGTTAIYSPAVYDNSVFWLTHDRAGHSIVMQATGYQTKRISTYAIEAMFEAGDILADAIGFVYQIQGHPMYVLTLPTSDQTWVYDISTEHWHEWKWVDDDGNEHRHRAMCYCPTDLALLCGDWQNGNIYSIDHRLYTDAGQPIKRVRSFPHLVQDGRRVFYREFIADMETGNAPGGLLLDATFTAPSGTPLEDYTSDVGGGWTAIDGADAAEIQGDVLVGTGGDALYQSAVVLPSADYSLHFDAVPAHYTYVDSGISLWVIGRATGAGNGYRVTVSADGTQYTLTLDVATAGTPAVSVVMGTIPSGRYTVWLVMHGTSIAAMVNRSSDGLWLASDATWSSDPTTIAAQFTDSTYTAVGSVMIGGVWPD